MGSGPDMGSGPGGGPNMNGAGGGSGPDGMDGMKHSPVNGPGTPRDDGGPGSGPGSGGGMTDYGMQSGPYSSGPGGDDPNEPNESAAIRKIKESMQEEAKRFEKETGPDHESQFFMQ